MDRDEVDRLGAMIDKLDVFDHPLTVHNRTGPDEFQDMPWLDFGTLQGPKTIDQQVLGIRPLKFEHAFWCNVTGQMATEKTSPAELQERLFLSGTRLREMLSRGERPPAEFTRPEVAEILLRASARS